MIVYGSPFWEFYNHQPEAVRRKINWTIGILRDLRLIPGPYLKHLTGTELYELRVSFGGNTFRILCFFESGGRAVLLNGFQKKTQKIPRTEIERARKLKRKYEEEQER